MPLLTLDSLDDARLAPYRNIRHREPAAGGHRFIAEGRMVVERLLTSRHRCESIVLEQAHHQEIIAAAARLDDPPPVFLLSAEQIRQLAGFDFHRGVLACGRYQPPQPLSALPPAEAASPALLFLVGLGDPENVGGLIRTAAAFGIRRLMLTADTSHPYSRRVLRVSMAAALDAEFFQASDPSADVALLADKLGYRTVATTLDTGAQRLDQFTPDRRPLALLVGHEAHGLPAAVQRRCTDRITIPMAAGIDSLNANVATAITLYALTR